MSNALEPERALAEGGLVGALLSLVLALVGAFGAIAFLRRPRLGRFVITTDDERSFSFVTDTGRFRIELEKRELTLRDRLGATRSIPLDQVEHLEWVRDGPVPLGQHEYEVHEASLSSNGPSPHSTYAGPRKRASGISEDAEPEMPPPRHRRSALSGDLHLRYLNQANGFRLQSRDVGAVAH